MSHYVIADLHGDEKRFRIMMDVINFSPDDKLYIIGDVIDRGRDGIKLLQEIRSRSNCQMLLGNHEWMMLKSLERPDKPVMRSNWIRNGGGSTQTDYLGMPPEEQKELLDWMQTLPGHMELNVDGKSFYLVHGWPSEDPYYEVWGRPDGLTDRSCLAPEAARLIIGHTPVVCVLCKTDQEQEAYLHRLEQENGRLHILHTPGFIDIDCGCGYGVPGACLACLRLEDMQEFYV